jgi:hypothetical protein
LTLPAIFAQSRTSYLLIKNFKNMNKKQMEKWGNQFIFCVGKYKTMRLKYFRGGCQISKEIYKNLEKQSNWIADYSNANGTGRIWIKKIKN